MTFNSEDYKKGYSAGYYRGAQGTWPAHRPPRPPDEIAAELINALESLRNGYDNLLATIGEDNELEAEFGPLIDQADAALIRVSRWLKQ